MATLNNIKVRLGEDLLKKAQKMDPTCKSFRILKKSLDARNKRNLHHVYSIETYLTDTPPPLVFEQLEKAQGENLPVTGVIGAGPAGIFAALRLLERGMPCFILERGRPIMERMRDISKHWKKGVINSDSNVCFGEGGAGTFSDGKLITRIKSPLIKYAMEQFVRFGAPEEILYLANPHVGSNKIRKIINALSLYLMENACPVHFNTRAEKFNWSDDKLISVEDCDGKEYKADRWILATGHSAHDVYEKIIEGGVPCEAKSMAMGFRVEHPQVWVNEAQYGERWEHEELPVANYKLTCHDKNSGIGVYSFCMCPGGYVLASSAQPGRMVVNGMSNYNHGSPFANSGIVISIDKDKWYPGGPLEALEFQKMIEVKTQEKVQEAGGTIEVPAQRVIDFLKNQTGELGKSSCPSGIIPVNLRDIYPEELTTAFHKAMKNFNRKMPGFIADKAILHGVESRTSSPIRVLRDNKELNSPKFKNLYPSGEGAGFAGGITSAAVDGIRIAESIFESVK
ncbi:MAG: NAD(P)/FAD-dependent oxidoreductase [Lentisphaerales bacterium]|nr:NAD(P)/FAD-dependent oxidoreductase [Lentisphaerales bacterium]